MNEAIEIAKAHGLTEQLIHEKFDDEGNIDNDKNKMAINLLIQMKNKVNHNDCPPEKIKWASKYIKNNKEVKLYEDPF